MRRFMAILLILFLLCGCTGQKGAPAEQATVFCMDTVMQLHFWGVDSASAADEISRMLYTLEETWSATSGTSLLASANAPGFTLSDEDQALLDRALELSRRTGGAFDPRLYNLTELWGFTTGAYRVPFQSEINAALLQPAWDLGGILKGYAGDQAVKRLQDMQITAALLNLGGNVQTFGTKADGTPWRIAIQDPSDPNAQAAVITVSGTVSIVTSGGYQRYFEGEDGTRYHHILDPKTGCPAQSDLASVTVLCDNGTTADALSTALFVMGLEAAVRFWQESDDFEAVFITDTGKIYATSGVMLSGCEFEVIAHE